MSRLPNFICVGAQKAGTTTLHHILKQHPDICLPQLKEAHFFNKEEKYRKGLEWWSKTFFHDCGKEKIVGVITPEYIYSQEATERIIQQLGVGLKIIIILRNPVDRAYSHYLMSVRRGHEPLSFQEAIDNEPDRIVQGGFQRSHFSYINRGLYANQVERYLNRFPPDNLLILSFENDIVNNIDATIVTIESFLGIDSITLNTAMKSNTASRPRLPIVNSILYKQHGTKRFLKRIIRSPFIKVKITQFIDALNRRPASDKRLTPAEKKVVMDEYFRDDITRLENILDRDFSYWYSDENRV